MAERYDIPSHLATAGRPHRVRERRVIATGVPGLRLRFYPGVRADVRERLKDFAGWLRREVEFRHPVHVTVVARATVSADGDTPGWAVFLIPPPDYVPGDVIRIVLGAGRVSLLETRYALECEEALRRVVHDLAHEIVHYEQWRDRREVTERNVNRRAAALTRKFFEGVGQSREHGATGAPSALVNDARASTPRPRQPRSAGPA